MSAHIKEENITSLRETCNFRGCYIQYQSNSQSIEVLTSLMIVSPHTKHDLEVCRHFSNNEGETHQSWAT